MRNPVTLVLLAGLAAGTHAAPERGLDVRVMGEVSTGSFAEPAGLPVQQTTLRLRYRSDRWSGQVELPWLRDLAARESALSPDARADGGLGDLRLKVTVPLRAVAPDATGLDLVVRAKSARTTMAGALDRLPAGQSIYLQAERPMGDWSAFGHAGLRRAGALPGSAPGRHAWVGELGASRRLTPKLEAGASVSARQRMAVSASLPEASLHAALDDGDWRWDFFVGRVFNRSYSDVSAGLVLNGKF